MIPRLRTGVGRVLTNIVLNVLASRVLVVVTKNTLLGLLNALIAYS